MSGGVSTIGTVGETVGGTVGGIAGGFAGGAIGSVFGPVGTVAGRFIGSRVGQWGGRIAGGYIASKMEEANEKAEPKDQSKTEEKEEELEDDCKGKCNKCDKLTGEVNRLRKVTQKRYTQMQEDFYKMKQGAKPPGKGDWEGHVRSFNESKTPLRKAINRAKRNGCPVPDGAEDWLDKDAPSQDGDAIS